MISSWCNQLNELEEIKALVEIAVSILIKNQMFMCECICNLNFFFEKSPLLPSVNCHSFCCLLHWDMQREGLPSPETMVNVCPWCSTPASQQEACPGALGSSGCWY